AVGITAEPAVGITAKPAVGIGTSGGGFTAKTIVPVVAQITAVIVAAAGGRRRVVLAGFATALLPAELLSSFGGPRFPPPSVFLLTQPAGVPRLLLPDTVRRSALATAAAAPAAASPAGLTPAVVTVATVLAGTVLALLILPFGLVSRPGGRPRRGLLCTGAPGVPSETEFVLGEILPGSPLLADRRQWLPIAGRRRPLRRLPLQRLEAEGGVDIAPCRRGRRRRALASGFRTGLGRGRLLRGPLRGRFLAGRGAEGICQRGPRIFFFRHCWVPEAGIPRAVVRPVRRRIPESGPRMSAVAADRPRPAISSAGPDLADGQGFGIAIERIIVPLSATSNSGR
ncbi:MAG: hypothetical protein EBZ59_04545, partial [Planctomycetia bacterium]|nr:hypothetical protein [Planctomycetia bacterium]